MATQERQAQKPVPTWPMPSRYDGWFLVLVLALGIGTVFLLAQLGNWLGQPALSISTTTRATQERLYPFSHTQDVGLMQPSLDTQGNLWVGEMYANRLARLNTHTGVVTTWKAPQGNDGIMDTTVDAAGNVWFVEQSADYLGRFTPTTQTFQIFPLGKVDGRPFGPQDLQFDARGQLWFTAPDNGRIGRLDPRTGRIVSWSVPAPHTGTPALPFSLTITPAGQVWFGYLTGGALGHFHPATGTTTLSHLSSQDVQIFSLSADTQGHLWFSEMLPGTLGRLDLQTGKVTQLPVPATSGQPAALYELVVTSNGAIWCVNSGADTLVGYTPGTQQYTLLTLNPSAGVPYGLALDASGRVWITASGSASSAVGVVTP